MFVAVSAVSMSHYLLHCQSRAAVARKAPHFCFISSGKFIFQTFTATLATLYGCTRAKCDHVNVYNSLCSSSLLSVYLHANILLALNTK